MRRIALLIFLLFTTITGCSKVEVETTDYSKHTYDEISEFIVSWNSIFSISSNLVKVYVYSETCLHCNSIKDYIISYALEEEDLYFVIYVDEIRLETNTELTIGAQRTSDVYIKGTPSLIVIDDNAVIENIAGTTNILRYLGL